MSRQNLTTLNQCCKMRCVYTTCLSPLTSTVPKLWSTQICLMKLSSCFFFVVAFLPGNLARLFLGWWRHFLMAPSLRADEEFDRLSSLPTSLSGVLVTRSRWTAFVVLRQPEIRWGLYSKLASQVLMKGWLCQRQLHNVWLIGTFCSYAASATFPSCK